MSTAHALDPQVEIRLAAHRLLVPLRTLAAQLGLPDAALRGALLALLLDPRARARAASACPDGQRRDHDAEGGGRGREERAGTFGNVTSEKKYVGTFTLRSDAREATALHSPRDLARRIAARLGDERSAAAYELLARRHPPELLERALGIVERTPSERIRGSPGAYFTGIVANLAKNPTPYDRTSPSAP